MLYLLYMNWQNPVDIKNYKHQYYLKHKKLYTQKSKDWVINHPTKRAESVKKYNDSHKEQISTWRNNNKARIKQQRHNFYMENRDRLLTKSIEYGKENKNKISDKRKLERLTNPEKVRANDRKYIKAKSERRKTNPHCIILSRLRARLYAALKTKHATKSNSTLNLVGCSLPELKLHIETQFYCNAETGEQMTWENKSKWHIDHKKPCASFDLTDPEQQKICFHYTNLQPLWANDNIKKGASLEPQPNRD